MVNFDIGKIAVLMGGPSGEREVSLTSGQTVAEALKEKGYDAVAIDVKNGRYPYESLKKDGISVAFIALHGTFGEDGSVQHILENLDIPYTGSGVESSRLTMDKIASREIFEKSGIPVPKYKILTRSSISDNVYANPETKLLGEFSLPVVVKPSSQGSSIGLSIVDKGKDLLPAMEAALNFGERVILEEYIRGREITVGILEDRPLPVIEILPKNRFFNYQAKYTFGQTDYIVPANIESKDYARAQEIALACHKALGCISFSRADMMLSQGAIYVLELNSIPGLARSSLLPKAAHAAGIDFAELCIKMINSSIFK